MPFLRDFLDKLFGGGEGRHENPRGDDNWRFSDRFRNPIWQNDEEDDDDYSDNNRRHAGPNFHFEIFTNPFEMTKYFEKQMDDLMKDFFRFGVSEADELSPFDGFQQLMPPPEKGDLRDEVLKPGYALPPATESRRYDEDLDGKVSPKDFGRVWEKSAEDQISIPSQRPSFRSFGQSVVSQTTRRPDGSIEERRTVKDSEGNTETVIKHRIGDKIHEVIVKTDKNGVETRTENFENMDPDEIKKFNNNWTPVEQPIVEPGSLSRFPWHKFFDFDPKI